MPIEIIRRLQKERQEEAARQEKTRQEELLKQILEQAEAAEKRRQFVVSVNNDINHRSNIFNFLTRIDKEIFMASRTKHKLVYVPETGKCVLAWGKNFEVDNSGEVHKFKEHDFSSIEVLFDPDQKTVTVRAKNTTVFNEPEWLNHEKVEQVLAESFLEPRRHYYFHGNPEDPGGDIGGGR